MSSPLVCVVTGASSGFGALIARALAKAGHHVYAGFSHPDDGSIPAYPDAAGFAKENRCDLVGIHLNVVEDDSIKKAIDQIIQNHGHVDVMVHNAGHMNFGCAESFTPEQFHELYEVNCVSCQRINRVLLPHMRHAGKGLLVWVSSSSAHGPGSPFLAPYFAAKAAQDSLAQTYAVEISNWGIETSIIVPGVFTRGTNHFSHAMKPDDEKTEQEYMQGPLKGFDKICLEGSGNMVPADAHPDLVAEVVVKVVATQHGQRPFRVHVEPDDGGATMVNAVRDVIRERYLNKMGCGDLLIVETSNQK